MFALIHYVLAFSFILLYVPRLFFQNQYQEGLERSVSDFLKMSMILLVVGNLLVLLRLFELLSLGMILIFVGLRIYQRRQAKKGLGNSSVSAEALIYDYFDGKYKLTQVLAGYARKQSLRVTQELRKRMSPRTKLIGTVSMLAVLITSSFTRFYEGVVHPSISYADRYSTLKWMKDIRVNQMFADGVLPQGFHIYWATIQEFARIDAIHVVQYTGLFTPLLIMGSIYFFLTRVTGYRMSGIAGMAVYAFLGGVADPHFWQWQLEASPRTFAHIFLLPALYFYIVYVRKGYLDAFYTMAAGMIVIAFIDPKTSMYLLAGIGLVSLYMAAAKMRSSRLSMRKMFLTWAGSIGVSVAPMAIGFLSGKELHLSVVQAFQSNVDNPFLLTASPSVAPLAISVALGFGWYVLFRLFAGRPYQNVLENSTLIVVILICIAAVPVGSTQSVKIDWDSTIAQYHRISSEFSPNTWMAVGKEPLSAVVQGRGYHMNVEQLVSDYDPNARALTRFHSDEPDLNVAPHVFLFYEKQLREVNDGSLMRQLEPSYDTWERNKKALRAWLHAHLAAFGEEVDVYYEDEYIIVYHVERKQAREEIQQEIWGGGSQ